MLARLMLAEGDRGWHGGDCALMEEDTHNGIGTNSHFAEVDYGAGVFEGVVVEFGAGALEGRHRLLQASMLPGWFVGRHHVRQLHRGKPSNSFGEDAVDVVTSLHLVEHGSTKGVLIVAVRKHVPAHQDLQRDVPRVHQVPHNPSRSRRRRCDWLGFSAVVLRLLGFEPVVLEEIGEGLVAEAPLAEAHYVAGIGQVADDLVLLIERLVLDVAGLGVLHPVHTVGVPEEGAPDGIEVACVGGFVTVGGRSSVDADVVGKKAVEHGARLACLHVEEKLFELLIVRHAY
mmetsp:Transcript_10081/g.17570  ORF Transcript_10081/g.17570 Transcript_10081/m.17570 type:complete len:287 (-) Transcript_10081:587-1447(-)